jgi:RES domain-containing protein
LKSAVALRTILRRVSLHVLSQHQSHIAQYRFRASLLSAEGAKRFPGRYHRKGGAPALYFADTPLTAIFEVDRAVDLGGIQLSGLANPGILISVKFELSDVLDLTDPEIIALLGTSHQELTGSWMSMNPAPTQVLGEAAYETGRIVAIKAPSAANRQHEAATNLVVFRDRLSPKQHKMAIHDPYNWLELTNPRGRKRTRGTQT